VIIYFKKVEKLNFPIKIKYVYNMSERISIKLNNKKILRDEIKHEFMKKIKNKRDTLHKQNRENRHIEKEWKEYINEMDIQMKKYIDENPITDDDIDVFYKEFDGQYEDFLKKEKDEIEYYQDLLLEIEEEDKFKITLEEENELSKMMESLNF